MLCHDIGIVLYMIVLPGRSVCFASSIHLSFPEGRGEKNILLVNMYMFKSLVKSF